MSSVIVTIILYEFITGKSTGILDAIDDTAAGAYGWLIQGWNTYRDSDEYKAEYHERAHTPFGGLHNLWDNILSSISGADLARWDFEENPPGL